MAAPTDRLLTLALAVLLAPLPALADPVPDAYRLQLDPARYQLRQQDDWQMPAPKTSNPVTEARPFAQAIAAAAQAEDIEPELLHAVVKTESNYQADAVSHKGAVGLAQLMPGTAARYDARALDDARHNLRVGARYLRQLLDRFDQDLPLALAAYNAGPGAVTRFGGIPPYPETRAYVHRVVAEYERLRSERQTERQPWQLRPLGEAHGAPPPADS